MDFKGLFIMLVPLIAPYLSIKIFEVSSKQALNGFVGYYNLWLYFFVVDNYQYYIVTLVFIVACTSLLVILSLYAKESFVPNVREVALYLGVFSFLFFAALLLGYQGVQWFCINIILMQFVFMVFGKFFNKKSES
ncbi:hypothetical protein HG263_16845 [Pseudoalteromonas sp. JBTF-M23]|uniref:Uncharacterized protein n=1 Tax=Pseudoalteromonas caenipelagi TaxID=2726988 RepID=A0A849VEQ4_9GAMM|nr:hypothetical protein [Pseudoalteromonas caenipelagi]NOU52199.1 hypothetical protein [Pseudoalteromonas caenipelagi]